MSSPLALDVADLSKKYGDRMALSHANFEVPMGSICGFVGPNGSGKTTTIRMLLGLIKPTTGSGHVLGESITEPEKYLPNVGAMIEGPAFYPALTGAQNLAVLAKLGGFDTNKIQELLELVDLGDRGNSKYKTYSLGMKQRLGIAASLLPNPKLLVLDEPTNGLDPAGIQEVRNLLRKLADAGTTVFVSSHLLSEIEMISDHLVMLRLGKVIFSGKTSELLAKQLPVIVAKPSNRDDLEKLVKIAKANGHDAKIIDQDVHVTGAADYSAQFNKSAFDAGIILESLTPIRPSLEDTFFEMTGD
ncbi:ABC-2 type transport system ATP-binding protein [Candidatus Nanopelagicus hibericus]|uniref:ABC-2 type transport system ATP-binding protein n=1 Tax=Candidatus Nanopelagicus hibericus TaxID=1884915 RepID=A0A249K7T3_9ACTN|nr:ABC transporter ATP-binding protein [Candidatus Nanopelagicus hibericus]ASY12805.1 ABC-2 type transport system ATP-binding protein [Candidatus Nanopelagicus hibericus]